jgi:hypothetical protein
LPSIKIGRAGRTQRCLFFRVQVRDALPSVTRWQLSRYSRGRCSALSTLTPV